MFKKAKIESIYGISNIEIDDLKQINLFVGKNGYVKTSILGCIYTLGNTISNKNLLDINKVDNNTYEVSFKHSYEDNYVSFSGYTTDLNKSGEFVYPNANIISIGSELKEIQKNKQSKKIAQILKKIKNDINDLQAIDNMIYCDIDGMDKLVPINTMGNGFLKILSIVMSVYSSKNGYVFIDEIENGLHHSVLESVWEIIFELASKFNIQVFATTNSYECIKAYYNVYNEYINKINGIRIYRIEKEKDNWNVVDYNEDDIRIAIERNWEIR